MKKKKQTKLEKYFPVGDYTCLLPGHAILSSVSSGKFNLDVDADLLTITQLKALHKKLGKLLENA